MPTPGYLPLLHSDTIQSCATRILENSLPWENVIKFSSDLAPDSKRERSTNENHPDPGLDAAS